MKKVLIIEDDSFLQGLEAGKLKRSGFDIITASSGEEAMKKIHEPSIDIVLLDLMLPDLDGFDILKAIKSTEGMKNTPVIVFSNLSEEEAIKRSKELGALDFMVKSNFTLDELVKRINEILK